MNRVFRLATTFALAMLFSSCASTTPIAAARGTDALAPGTPVTDRGYMAAVHAKAQRRGVEVHWVNPPMTRVPPRQQ
ncbi:hypothetical protein [Luteimonas kalidii]|uniref:Uncharacterized protein n=1 Tax=Luteimonas kalidii TaxID=3042025 RepID=A0ABT6JP94_9GAMM|nr:hypothetical protein [Luteimonas kalidii]MDH5832509.1 hypothetical protein [Luteimonas kalidii]